MEWSKDGDILAVIQDTTGMLPSTTTAAHHLIIAAHVTLWDAATQKSDQIDSALKSNLSFLAWSKTSMLLAVGLLLLL